MSWQPCASMCEGCPLSKPYSDQHHLAYYRPDYISRVERQWRELEFNKIDICRCLHNAIHTSGYVPDKPSREVMLQEIWAKEVPERAIREAELQEFIGRNFMENGDAA